MKVLYNLHIAKNGQEALEMLNNQPPLESDFTLIDINMPKMNGLEFLSVLRNTAKWKHLKCFIITTSDEKLDRETAKALGISGYIIKPHLS